MDASLSGEEFQRMQEHLIELRTKNYTLGEKNVKVQTELLLNNKVLEDMKKELAKCQKIISRSKNSREIELLVQENESLQQKLQMQEDEFRLQNETIMQELSSVIGTNEEMSKELELAKSQHLPSSNFLEQDARIKLEAENKALKNLITNQEKNYSSVENDCGDSSKIAELELKLSTIMEEKKLLQDNMIRIDNEYRTELLQKQAEVEKMTEKLKKKQESFLQVQNEKEKIYEENKHIIQNLQASKAAEIQQLKDQIKIVQLDLRGALQLNEQFIGTTDEDIRDATVEISGDKATFECSLNETKLSVLNIQKKLQTLNHQLIESQKKVNSLEVSNSELAHKLQDFEKTKAELEEAVQEKSRLAEQRRKLIDDMNDHLLETTNKHSSEIETLTQKLADEQEAFKKIFDKEKETKLKLVECRKEVQALRVEIERITTECTTSEEQVTVLEEKLQTTIVSHEDYIEKIAAEHTETLNNLKQTLDYEIKDLTIQIELARAEKSEYEEKVGRLQQEAKDSIVDRKIQEKKGLAMVKDLKRQLQVERNRAEKLQERLQEVLNQQNQTVDEILQPSNSFEKPKGDASSISSWSYVSGGTADRENKDVTLQSDTSSGGHESPNHGSPTLLETETTNLLAKVAQLQQKSWILEEKVNHLELSNEALVDDVLKKTAIIQFYCMEGRADSYASVAQDKLTIKKIVDFIKDRGDENLKEMNRRMQRMLEETLTKNMHLQKDIETLSNEVSRLSKHVCPPVENGIQSAVFVDGV